MMLFLYIFLCLISTGSENGGDVLSSFSEVTVASKSAIVNVFMSLLASRIMWAVDCPHRNFQSTFFDAFIENKAHNETSSV